MVISSPRSPYGGDLTANSLYQSILDRYVNNWGANVVNQGMDEIIAALQSMTLPGDNSTTATDIGGGDTTIIRGGGGGGGGRNRDARLTAGYPAPGGRNPIPASAGRSPSGWAIPLAAMGLTREAERAVREARRAVRNGEDGVYVDPARERTRERSRTRTSRDGTTTTSTNVNISRNGGTAVAIDSGEDGNQQRRRRRERGY